MTPSLQSLIKPIQDADVPKKFQSSLKSWRKLADHYQYTGPVVWEVQAGYTIKDIPKFGNCYDNWEYMKDREFRNDEPTRHLLIFCIPVFDPKSANKTVKKQQEWLSSIRKKYYLPEHHFSSFGNATVLAGLMLLNKEQFEEYKWFRTDLLFGDGCRFGLEFYLEGLCGSWHWDGVASSSVGCFLLGVEELESLDTQPSSERLDIQSLESRVLALEQKFDALKNVL